MIRMYVYMYVYIHTLRWCFASDLIVEMELVVVVNVRSFDNGL